MVPEKKTSSATCSPAAGRPGGPRGRRPSGSLEAEQRNFPLRLGQGTVLAHHLHGGGTDAAGVVKGQGITRRDHDITDALFDAGADRTEETGGYGVLPGEGPNTLAEPAAPRVQQALPGGAGTAVHRVVVHIQVKP